tara:strand:+ start:319 stop:501 length:183 start_codon:yes stop_codon:yes gene_type:complete
MIITKAQYRNIPIEISGQQKDIVATIDGIEMSVPIDTANRHYREILIQVEEGTLTIKDAD